MIVFLLVAVAVGYAGVRFGRSLRERSAHPVAESVPFPFQPGSVFPDVTLADSLGRPVQTHGLIEGRGAVVLFLDPSCDGCTDMSIRWEHALAAGFFDPSRVFGVSPSDGAAIRGYRARYRLSFPIYEDVEDAFLNRHQVASYPLELVVGRSGTIRAVSNDSASPVEVEPIRVLMTE